MFLSNSLFFIIICLFSLGWMLGCFFLSFIQPFSKQPINHRLLKFSKLSLLSCFWISLAFMLVLFALHFECESKKIVLNILPFIVSILSLCVFQKALALENTKKNKALIFFGVFTISFTMQIFLQFLFIYSPKC